ncbi:MAG: universal stress protein [Flavobacteriales bacterium]|nr:universal stress protein [Flavobacteriales bacterium]MBP9080229.1 universal stress protein [Flavobacteriales bacterium]
MKHILLPTDFSDTSNKAGAFALRLFGAGETRYTLLNVYLKLAYRNALVAGTHDTGRASRNGLRRVERRLRKQAGRVQLALRSTFSALANAIDEVHAERPVDLVVMGTQGEGNYGLVGRNTSAAVTSATLPVIAVPAQWQPADIDRILFADDGQADSPESLRPLLWIAKRTGAHITVFNVGEKEVDAAQRKVLKALLHGVPHSFASAQGEDVAKTLERLTVEGGVDLVAVVRRKRSFWHRLFQGSTSKRMALHTNVPLLVLRG